MKINKLYIKNFKNVSEIEIDSFKRINLISGSNGEGKSSVLQALGFILTNDLEEKIENYVRWGTDKFEIVCEFDHEGVNYLYEIEGSKSCKKKLTINDKEEFVNSEASKKLAEVIDPLLTKYSAISEQGKTTQLLFQKPAERLKTIKEILKIDSIFKAVDNIKEDAKNIKTDIEKIDAEQIILKGRSYTFLDEDELKKQVDADANIDSLIEGQNKTKLVWDKEQKDLEQYTRDLESYNIAVKNRGDLDKNISECKDEITTFEKQKVPVSEFDETILNDLCDKFKILGFKKVRYDAEIKAYNEAQIQIASVNKSIVDIDKSLSEIQLKRLPACPYNDSTIQDIDDKINKNTSDLSVWQDKKKLAEGGKCPTCGQDYKVVSLDEINKSIKDLMADIDALKAEKINEKKQIDNYNKLVEDQREKVIRRASLTDKRKFYEDQKAKYELISAPEDVDVSLIDSLKTQIINQEKAKDLYTKSKKKNDDLQAQIDKAASQISFYEKELIKIGTVCQPIKPEVTVSPFDETFYESLKKRLAVKEQKEAEYKRAVEFNISLKEEKKANDKKIESNDRVRESLLKEINILTETRNVLEKDFSSFLIDKSITNIKDWMNAFFQQTYNKYEVTVEQDKNSVNFFYKGNEDVLTPCSMASGFERSLLAIANRVALSKIQDLGFLILDECDADASDSNSLSMFQNLTNQNQFTQFFIITHCESTKEFFESNTDCEMFEVASGELV